MMTERIQKIISDCGVTSRRKAEAMISEGRVKVNGRPCKLGDKADPRKDIISIDGINLPTDEKKNNIYIMLNKPRGYVTTMSDDRGRRCVTELLEGVEERVYPIGRLDMNSEGLLLFTNDGAMANAIMHPSCHISKTYRVTVRPDITEEQLVELSEGVVLDDGKKTLPATVLVLTKEEGRVVLQITIREGRNRQIRRMCNAVGLEVARLKRTAVGPIKLGMLKSGDYRELTPAELTALRNAIQKGSASSQNKNNRGKRK
ncbi:MAG: rRNA pseudouridine synthase [Oscillospiraceae bacterium]|nr:rRNA pseudouridine synthase [Oscillospiraceae bacterium]